MRKVISICLILSLMCCITGCDNSADENATVDSGVFVPIDGCIIDQMDDIYRQSEEIQYTTEERQSAVESFLYQLGTELEWDIQINSEDGTTTLRSKLSEGELIQQTLTHLQISGRPLTQYTVICHNDPSLFDEDTIAENVLLLFGLDLKNDTKFVETSQTLKVKMQELQEDEIAPIAICEKQNLEVFVSIVAESDFKAIALHILYSHE